MTERILSHAATVRPMTGALAVFVRLNALRWPISYSTIANVKGPPSSFQWNNIQRVISALLRGQSSHVADCAPSATGVKLILCSSLSGPIHRYEELETNVVK